MSDKIKNEIKLANFYQSLPDDMLKNAILNLDANRHYRRSLSKTKNKTEKVIIIIKEPTLRKSFTYNLYEQVREQIPLSLADTDYYDIINSINEENKELYCIFFFRWCYENDKNGESNDRFFDQFIDSELPDVPQGKKATKHLLSVKSTSTSVQSEGVTIEKNEIIDEIDAANENTIYSQAPDANTADKTVMVDIDTSTKKTTKTNEYSDNMEDNKMIFIGHIEKRNTFYNFFPQFELKDGNLEELSPVTLKQDYPDIGGINLAVSYSDGTAQFFESKNIDRDDDNAVTNSYIVKIDSYYLDKNNNETYKVKLNLTRLVHDGIMLDKIITPAYKSGIYKVVECEYTNKPLVEIMGNNIMLNNTNIIENENVVMFHKGKYYGPFKVKRSNSNGKYFIKPDNTNHLVPFYPNENVQYLELEKQSFYEDPTYTPFIYTTGAPKLADIMPDEVLLSSISENISLEVAAEKPEEFINSYMKMPFVSTLPDSVAQERLERLQRIISDTEAFSDIKQELLSSLLKSLPDTASNLSNQMATESQEYKDLQSQYLDERNKNEENEKLIQKLKKENQEKDQKISDLECGNSNISSDEAIKLKEELSEYKKIITDKKETEHKIQQLRDEPNTTRRMYRCRS